MTRTSYNKWLHRFAVLTAVSALLLICVGGLVTSHGVGMSVPDWPTTYGHNMFLFPFSKWVGGILYEHSHRLAASLVGFMSVLLAIWLWWKEDRPWLRRLGYLALFSVIVQGLLGGLRVTLYKDELGIFHATLAQMFFVLVCAIALFSSRWWTEGSKAIKTLPDYLRLRGIYMAVSVLILLQLALGATMRHQHAGLAIPDFPTAYGKWWPDTDSASIERYNQVRIEVLAAKPITAAHVVLQMIHRGVAALILISVAAAAWLTLKQMGRKAMLSKLALGWLALICGQVLLGAYTIWSGKSPKVATAHVAIGAMSLAMGSMLYLLSLRFLGQRSAVSQSTRELAGAGAVGEKLADRIPA